MKIKYIVSAILLAAMFISCNPRIEMDLDQWGDQTLITNIQVFKFEVDDNPDIYETINDIGDISGLRRIIISSQATVDEENSTVSIPLIGDETLNEAGFIFFHQSANIEPLNGAPKGGVISDLSGKSFVYRLHSVNGATKDWTVTITN